MKSRIFELYKPKSLTEFLTFHKENPNETFVYVLQQPPQNINILGASDFGYLVICLPPLSQAIFSSGPFVFKMRKNLQWSDLIVTTAKLQILFMEYVE